MRSSHHPNPLIISCAPTGAETSKEHNPNVPETPLEIIASTVEAVKAGACQVHLHARDVTGKPSSDARVMNEIIRGIRNEVDVIIEVSTGGDVSWSVEERIAMLGELAPKPDFASLSLGSINFGDGVFLNPVPTIMKILEALSRFCITPQFEIMDVGWIDTLHRLVAKKLVIPPFATGFGFNIPGGGVMFSPARLLHWVSELPPGAVWGAMGVGRDHMPVLSTSIAVGGHIRVGFEDNVMYSKDVPASSNAQFVKRAVRIAEAMERPIHTAESARQHYRSLGFCL